MIENILNLNFLIYLNINFIYFLYSIISYYYITLLLIQFYITRKYHKSKNVFLIEKSTFNIKLKANLFLQNILLFLLLLLIYFLLYKKTEILYIIRTPINTLYIFLINSNHTILYILYI